MNATAKTEIKKLEYGEAFTVEVWEGYRKPLVKADIYLQQGKTKNIADEACICIKKHNARNINQGQYSCQWLFTYNNNIYGIALNYQRTELNTFIPAVSKAVKAHNVELTETEKNDIIEQFKAMPEIQKLMKRAEKIDNIISSVIEKRAETAEIAKTELLKLSIEEIREYLKNLDNWKVITVDRNYSNKPYVVYRCIFHGISLFEKYVHSTETVSRLTAKVKQELAETLKSELSKLTFDRIEIKNDYLYINNTIKGL